MVSSGDMEQNGGKCKEFNISINNQIHQHNTRNASKLHKCYKRTNYVKHTLSNKGVDVWNSLETKLNQINSYKTFKKRIKQHFLLYTIANI
jgi:hypothetical protein